MDETKSSHNPKISLIWILIYLPAHQFIAQTFPYYDSFLFLRLLFLSLVVITLFLKDESSQICTIFMGRLPRSKKDWLTAVVFLFLIFLAQQLVSRTFHFRTEQPSMYFEIAITAPINEEIVFRGLFLAALLAYFPRFSFSAILLTTAMFVSCHDLTYSVWQVWVALAVQSVIYGVCYLWTRCVLLCILCHWLWNTLFFI